IFKDYVFLARRIIMPLISKALGATLGILALGVVIAAPAFAQQNPPMPGQEPPLDEQLPSEPPPNGQPPGAELRPGSVRTALVTADVNLRSGPGTNAPIIATIP